MTVNFITRNFGKYDPSSLDSYLKIGGFSTVEKALKRSSAEIIEIISQCSIKGRGGAEYELARKWTQAAEVPGDRKAVICNADEGEPCTFKDRAILEHDPFALIEGIIICAHTVGANEGYIYIREEYRELHQTIKQAIAQCRAKGYLGRDFDIQVYSGAGAYVCGEGSTLIESMEGKSGRPRIKPPYIKQSGLWQLPTCINNVETLALACAVLQMGADTYTQYGVRGASGTKMISLAGNVKRPGFYEIPFGLTIREIIYDIGGGITDNHELKFFQLGGVSGRIGPASLIDTPYTYSDLRKASLSVGSGGILVADKHMSIINFTKLAQAFFLHESCGKCTPCREGNRHISDIINRLAAGTSRANDLETAKKFARVMSDCSFCGLGQTAQNVFLSAVEHFPEEFTAGGEGL